MKNELLNAIAYYVEQNFNRILRKQQKSFDIGLSKEGEEPFYPFIRGVEKSGQLFVVIKAHPGSESRRLDLDGELKKDLERFESLCISEGLKVKRGLIEDTVKRFYK